MNIIHLVRAETWGGGERYALDLCRESIKAGYSVTVVTRGEPIIDKQFAEAGADIKHLPLGGFTDLRSPFLLARMINRMKGEAVMIHVHTFKDAEIVARAKKLVREDIEMRLVCTRHLVKRAKRSKRWKFIFSAIDALIFVSELAKNRFLSGNPQIDPKKIAVVHNSILVPESFRELKSPPGASPLILLYTGRISPEKGIDILIKAFSKLSDLNITLRIAGTGKEEYVNQLKSLAANYNISSRIEWLGFVPMIYEAIIDADICISPSTVEESFGLTVIEYMSQGRPVITTTNGAQKEIISNRHDGLLVEPGDVESLADSIKELANDKDFRLKLGSEAIKTFNSRFSYKIFFEKILEIYHRVFL